MKFDVSSIEADLVSDFSVIRAEMTDEYKRPISEAGEQAIARLETFCAISLRVMRKTNPSKLRDAARTEEILARVHGKEVLE